jgi:hypothetical protein
MSGLEGKVARVEEHRLDRRFAIHHGPGPLILRLGRSSWSQERLGYAL